LHGEYSWQFSEKEREIRDEFGDVYSGEIDRFYSPEQHYRARAEFRIWHDDGKIFYAMSSVEKRSILKIDSCPMVLEPIAEIMPSLIEEIQKEKILSEKLFSIEFLSNRAGEMVITLIYHKKLSEEWRESASKFITDKISIIGRSRKQKEILGRDYIEENLDLKNRSYRFKHLENSFSQPNPAVNEKMVDWILSELQSSEDSNLIELYCGSGNFTIPLASKFHRVVATEVAKSGIATATENMERNGVTNIEFGRVSSEEFVQAIDGVRPFNRLQHINLKTLSLDTIFVDPPRAGLDSETLKFVSRFKNILYISCNPETLKRDLEILQKSHSVNRLAMFDQFPYTHHMEMGASLQRVEN
jgi:tRNA (uracil-5-)-methyltransferase